jgi:hypothetical protein
MLTVDPEKDVRDEAFKTIKMFTQKLEKVSESPELALEMEKDVSSCSLDLKNETSWTSWAMTSLSAKMTGYKNKSQQPSVALNMQPLGQSPSLAGGNTGTSQQGEEKKSSRSDEIKSATTAGKKTTETGSESKLNKIESTSNININNASNSNGSGWMEDNEWKDLEDDDEMMEPIEPIDNNRPKPNLSTTKENNSQQKENNDWSNNDWSNSFEDEKNNSQFSYDNFTNEANDSSGSNRTGGTKMQSKIGSSSNMNTQLPPSSAYNWNNSNTSGAASNAFFNDPIKNEEDLFSNLVKDMNITNKVAILVF